MKSFRLWIRYLAFVSLVLFACLTLIASGGGGGDDGDSSNGGGQQDVVERATGFVPLPTEIYNSIPLATPRFGASGALPVQHDLSADFPVPGDQGNASTCLAWAVGYGLKGYQEKIERGWNLSSNNHLFSPTFIYSQRSNKPGIGMSFADGLNIVQGLGDSTLETMPYNPNNVDILPTQAAYNEAVEFRIDRFWRVNLDFNELKTFLYEGFPILIGIKTYPDLSALNVQNQIYDDTSGVPGFPHAVVLTGYDDNLQAFKFFNSWGTDWGIGGFGYISYDIFMVVTLVAYVADDNQGQLNNAPIVEITTPNLVQIGQVAIDYTLVDAESDLSSITVEYSINGGSTYMALTHGSGGDGTTGLISSPDGESHTFIWDSVADLGQTSHDNIRIRISGNDGTTEGLFTQSNLFSIHNDISSSIFEDFESYAPAQLPNDYPGNPVYIDGHGNWTGNGEWWIATGEVGGFSGNNFIIARHYPQSASNAAVYHYTSATNINDLWVTFKYLVQPNADLFISLSEDGINFVDASHKFPFVKSTITANTSSVNVGALLSGSSSEVWIRFRTKGYAGTWWMTAIDDLRVSSEARPSLSLEDFESYTPAQLPNDYPGNPVYIDNHGNWTGNGEWWLATGEVSGFSGNNFIIARHYPQSASNAAIYHYTSATNINNLWVGFKYIVQPNADLYVAISEDGNNFMDISNKFYFMKSTVTASTHHAVNIGAGLTGSTSEVWIRFRTKGYAGTWWMTAIDDLRVSSEEFR